MPGTGAWLWVAGVGLDFIEEAQLHLQPGKAAVIETRMQRVNSACHVRGAKPSKAWGLTKEVLAV